VHRLFGQERQGRLADRATTRVELAAAAMTVSLRLRTTVASAAAGVVEAGETARMSGAGRLGRDGVITPMPELMCVWSVPSGTATGGFEVHSILSVGWGGAGLQ
jgi:hypothetical protein